MINLVQIQSALATNSVADGTGIDLAAAAQLEAGPAFANVGNANSILMIHLDAGATPGAYDIEVQQSNDDVNYTTLVAIDEATVGTIILRNVTVTGRYLRVTIEEATANAGTVSAWLISA